MYEPAGNLREGRHFSEIQRGLKWVSFLKKTIYHHSM